MTQIISRTYNSRENADAAVAELKKVGFAERIVSQIEPGPSETVKPALTRAGIAASHAAVFADHLQRGETLVSIRAPFGFAALATSILDKHHPTETDLGEQGYETPPPDPAAPFSSRWGWSVLSHDPTPLSSAFGWRVLSDSRKPRRRDEDLIDNPAPLSRTFDMPLLSPQPAPLSQRFGWKQIWENAAPLSSRFGWRVLSKEQSIGDKSHGAKVLLDDPAPLSSRLNWKLLSQEPAPLSKLFNWRVLTRD